jgi:hypothetical protein
MIAAHISLLLRVRKRPQQVYIQIWMPKREATKGVVVLGDVHAANIPPAGYSEVIVVCIFESWQTLRRLTPAWLLRQSRVEKGFKI